MNARKHFRTLLLPLLAPPLAALADPVYTMTFAPAGFGGSHMNNAGVVVGTFGTAAATWSNSGISDIGALAPNSHGYAINNRGDIGGSWGDYGFIYSAGAIQTVKSGRDWETTYVTALNDVGQAAGRSHYGPGEAALGFVYSGGVMHFIPSLGGDASTAVAINNAGTAVGTSHLTSHYYGDTRRHAFMFQGDVLQDLGTFGGVSSDAKDINDAGQIVGNAETIYGAPHAFLYEHGAMTDLGLLGGTDSFANGINSAGQIVGSSEWTGLDYHAFLYANHQMVDLNTLIDPASGWRLTSANDINDAQQILATACRVGEACTTVRLDLISAVPEPKVWGMLLAGLVLMGSRRRRALRSEAFS